MAYNFDGFWADIGGSVADYYDFSMQQLRPDAPFSFMSGSQPFLAGPQVRQPCGARLCRAVVLYRTVYRISWGLFVGVGGGCLTHKCGLQSAVLPPV